MKEPKNHLQSDYVALIIIAVAVLMLIGACIHLYKNFKPESIGISSGSFSEWLKKVDESGKLFVKKVIREPRSFFEIGRDDRRHLSLGHENFRKKDFDRALAEYNRSIQIDEHNPDSYYWRARTFVEIGQYENAVRDLKTAIELNDRYTAAYDYLGWLYIKQKLHDESMSYLNKSIEINPDNGWALYNRGRIHFIKGDLEDALNDAQRACELGFKDACEVYRKYKP
ncbi:tetratricopeptide repeat protein [Thermodesulfobacteriota bacterium]